MEEADTSLLETEINKIWTIKMEFKNAGMIEGESASSPTRSPNKRSPKSSPRSRPRAHLDFQRKLAREDD